MSVDMGTGIEGWLGPNTPDIIIGEVCWDTAAAGTTGNGGGTCEPELLADHICLLEEMNKTIFLWSTMG